jgi:hypothetical protein
MSDSGEIVVWVQDVLSSERFLHRCTGELLDNAELKRDVESSVLVRTVNTRAESHVTNLEELLEKLDATPSLVGRTVGAGLGATLGWMERLPNRSLPQFVRDVYVALNFTAGGYHFMYTTAVLLDHQLGAQLALRNLRDYTPAIRELSKSMVWAAALELPFADWQSDPRMRDLVAALVESWSSEQPLFR